MNSIPKRTLRSKIMIASLLITTMIFGCSSGGDQKNDSPQVVVEDTVYDRSGTEDSVAVIKNKSLLWRADEATNYKLQKPATEGIDTMPAINVIQLINAANDSIRLEFVKTSHDTVFVHIPESHGLTEQIGSTGAEMYLASTTYSLTGVKGVRYVNYDFVEGDHAAPGVYSRDNFKQFR